MFRSTTELETYSKTMESYGISGLLSGTANADGLVRGCFSIGGGSVDAAASASIVENDSFDSFGNPGPYPTISTSSSTRIGGVGDYRTPPMTTRGLGSCVAEETVCLISISLFTTSRRCAGTFSKLSANTFT